MNTPNTKEDNSLHRFELAYESSLSAEQEIADAIARRFNRGLEAVVLRMIKIGLLPLMRFGKRVK